MKYRPDALYFGEKRKKIRRFIKHDISMMHKNIINPGYVSCKTLYLVRYYVYKIRNKAQ